MTTEEKFDVRVVTRITASWDDQLNMAVKASGLPRAEFLREAIKEAIAKVESPVADDQQRDQIEALLSDRQHQLVDAQKDLSVAHVRIAGLEALVAEHQDRIREGDHLNRRLLKHNAELVQGISEARDLGDRWKEEFFAELQQRGNDLEQFRRRHWQRPWWQRLPGV